jgi:hypothetical protein
MKYVPTHSENSSNTSVFISQKCSGDKIQKKQKQSLSRIEIHVTTADINKTTLGIKRYLSTIDIHTRSNVDVATCAILRNLIIPKISSHMQGSHRSSSSRLSFTFFFGSIF